MVMRGSDISIDTVTDANKKDVAITAAIIYPAQQFGELAAIHFLARDHYFSEYFPQHVAAETAGHLAKKRSPAEQIVYLFEKTNLLLYFSYGAVQIGRLKLAETLSTM